jgi:ubiquinone/menaquinone biosynthesis C-methylase UbiE
MDQTHQSRIEAAFTKQAGTFEEPDLNLAFTSGLPWLLRLAAAEPTDTVLDVAGGTGLVARALARTVRSATVLDATEAMLAAGRAGAAAEKLDNVRFLHGDAAALPFDDETFSLVVTRFSLHHFADPQPMLDELVRVTAPGGRVVVKDLVASPDPALAGRQDEIERLRDDSHVQMPVQGTIGRWLEERGCEVLRSELKTLDRPLRPWLEQSVTPPEPSDAVRARLREEVSGGARTGMRPHLVDDELWFHQTWETTVARRQAR